MTKYKRRNVLASTIIILSTHIINDFVQIDIFDWKTIIYVIVYDQEIYRYRHTRYCSVFMNW